MRVAEIRATPVAVPFRQDEYWAYGRRHGLVSIVLELVTDDGLVGLGEAVAYPSTDLVLAAIDAIRPLVVGESPFHIERILKRIMVAGTWHVGRANSPAIAGVEMACWDIVGKACQQPLVNLFGGPVRDSVEFFYYLGQAPPDHVADDARRGAREGFTTFYLKVGSADPRDDIARVEAARDALGPDALLRVDANESWSPAAAVRIIRELERYTLEFVEQPISGYNLAEMAELRRRISTPLLANEASWTRYDQLRVIAHHAADVISVDNQLDAGMLNMKRSAGLCEAAGLPVLKHSAGELGIAMYAGVHVMASTPNFLPASQSYASLLSDDIVNDTGPLPYTQGRLAIPQGAGLGIELDRERFTRYADLYQQEGDTFAFHDPDAMHTTPLLPKH